MSLIASRALRWARLRCQDVFNEIEKVVGRKVAAGMFNFTAQRNSPDGAPMKYCCDMREKYVVGILAENAKASTPVDVIDFTDFENKSADGRPVLRIKFCPFCGKPVTGPLRVV